MDWAVPTLISDVIYERSLFICFPSHTFAFLPLYNEEKSKNMENIYFNGKYSTFSLAIECLLLLQAWHQDWKFGRGASRNVGAKSASLGWDWDRFNRSALWEQTYQKHYTNWYFGNIHLILSKFTKYLVNVLKFTKYSVNSYHQKGVKHYVLTNWNQMAPI